VIKGIGIDICELKRIESILQKQPKFVNRILTDQEKLYLEGLSDKRKVEFIAGRFAAKEAFSKAKGTGIGSDVSFLDIEIHKDDKGKPYIIKPESKEEVVHLSISHSKEYAVAQVIIESSSS
jgi:holo-[acyl-carrier protein] synthase